MASRIPTVCLLGLALLLPAPLLVAGPSGSDPTRSEEAVDLRIKPLPEGVRKVRLVPDGEGNHLYLVHRTDGTEALLRPADFTRSLYEENRRRGWLFAVLNITSAAGIAWVALGLMGQVLFTGRMVLQWLVSERRKRSVVPAGFWWMSLAGASMLLVYFVWRKDIVGVLGQSAGWMIYVRNLSMIYRERHAGARVAG